MATALNPTSALTERGCTAPLSREATYTPSRGTELTGIGVVLVFVLLAAPLPFGAVQAWAWGALALAASVLLLWWAVTSVRQGVVRFVWSPLYLPGLSFLLLGVVQLLGDCTHDAHGTREALLKLATDLTFFFLAAQFFPISRGAWHRLGFAVTVFAFLLALFAVLQFYSDPTRIYWSVKPRWPGWIFGPYVNHNHYAGLMEMLIPVACGYMLTRRAILPARLLMAVAVLLPFASVFLSGSRGGSVALSIEACLFIGILLRNASVLERTKLAQSALLGIAGAALVFFWMDTNQMSRRLATVFEVSRLPEVGLAGRKATILDSLRMLRDHPWMGTGLGSFEVAFPPYQSLPTDDVWDHAHNDLVEALAETGLVGGLLITAALAFFFRLAFTDLRARLRLPDGWLQVGAAVGCCGLLVHSLCDFNLHIPANAAWFAVCAAWATCGSPPAQDESQMSDARLTLVPR
jgi:O-antigen ligase